jgi:hypothetical protein
MAKAIEKSTKDPFANAVKKPLKVGDAVVALASIAGCNPDDKAEITEVKHGGAMFRIAFITGPKCEVKPNDYLVRADYVRHLPPAK